MPERTDAIKTDNDALMSLPKLLETLRKGVGFTMQEVADTLGIARADYVYLEAGVTAPKAKEMLQVAALYGVPIDVLMSASIEKKPNPERAGAWTWITGEEARLLLAYRDHDFKTLLAMIAERYEGER